MNNSIRAKGDEMDIYASPHVIDTLEASAAILRETRTRAEGPLLEYLVERTIQDVTVLVEQLRFDVNFNWREHRG